MMNMKDKELDDLYERREKLEKRKISYLEVDKNAYANRIQKEIDYIEAKIELKKYNKVKEELEVYKEVVKKYPGITIEVNHRLRKDIKK